MCLSAESCFSELALSQSN